MAHPLPGPKRFDFTSYLGYFADPTSAMQKTAAKYGDTFRIATPFGPTVVTCHPDGIRDFFTADPDTFEPYRVETSAPIIGDTSLVLVSGARHRRDRKLLSPSFHGARMRAYGSIMAEAADRAAASFHPGQQMRMLEVTQAISLDIILHAVFGLSHDAGKKEAIHKAILELVRTINPFVILATWARRDFFGFGPWARFRRASANLDALLYEVIAARRNNPEPREDLLSLMMRARYDDGGSMSDKELRDQMLTLLFGGHETTAVALAWSLYWLHKLPDELARVREEVAALGPDPEPDAVNSLPYLDAFCHEALRINPVIAEVPRFVRTPLEVMGYAVPAGCALTASIILVHHRPELYPEPRRFRPCLQGVTIGLAKGQCVQVSRCGTIVQAQTHTTFAG